MKESPQTSNGGTKIALVLLYEGSSYSGFQVQRGAPTIQAELEKAIKKLTSEAARVKPASRTDSGAHALGQVVTFTTATSHPPETFVSALNHFLPEDIAVEAAYRVAPNFDARRSAVSREYRYLLRNAATPSPFWRRFACLMRVPLDLELMWQAAQHLLGTQDFRAFAGAVPEYRSTIRHMLSIQVRQKGPLVSLDFKGNAFLPQQVRQMSGALVEVGLGRLSIEELLRRKQAGGPGSAGPTLPACGLYLVKVNYRDFPPATNEPQSGRV